jgi:exonuclease SbcC
VRGFWQWFYEVLLQELLAKKEVLEKEIKKHEEQSAKVSQLTQCPTCYQEVKGEHKKKIEQLTKEHTTKLKGKLRELELACKDEERKLAKLLEQEKDFNQIEKEVRNIEELSHRRNEQMQEKHRLEEELSLIIHKKQQIPLDEEENTKLSQAIARLEEQLEESKEMFKRKERLERITQQEKELSKREKTACIELSQIDEMLRKFDEQVEEYQQGIAKLTDLSLNLSKKQTKVNDLKKALMQLQQEKVRYETEKELLLEQKKNLENKLNDLDKIAQTTQELMEKRMFLEKNIIPLQQQLEELTLVKLQQQCSAHFSRWFNKLIESDEIEAHLDEAFSPRIISQGHEVDIEHLSGGEKTAVAFAYRLALNQLITSQLGDIHAKNLLILDEPTEGFSSEQLDRMRDVLDEVEANQIIIVSHEQKMESFCENIIHIEKTNGVSHAR